LLTNSGELDARARALRNYGQSGKYKHDIVGYNSRLDELHAAYLQRVGLPRLAAWTLRRKQIAAGYLAEIASPFVRSVGSPHDSDSCWHLFPMLVEPARKEAFRKYLQSKGIQSGEHYPIAIPEQDALQGMEIELPFGIPKAREFCHSEVSIPIHPYLTAEDLGVIVDAINSWKG
jgi:dTDP-4-amino-4,6-dideoxygalactose transaminase